MYILPAILICSLLGYVYKPYSSLPHVEAFLFGLRPATTALVIGTVFRLAKTTLQGNLRLTVLCGLAFVGSWFGFNEVLLLVGAGLLNRLFAGRNDTLQSCSGSLFLAFLWIERTRFSVTKLFLIFLKIWAVLYGSGYVLYAYMNESRVSQNHW